MIKFHIFTLLHHKTQIKDKKHGKKSRKDAVSVVEIIEKPNIEYMSELNYEEKVKFYKESKYQCIKDFVDENKSWDSTKIQRRAKEMAKQIYNDFLRNICIY